MTAYLIPGVTGLIMGLLLHWAGFSKADNLRLSLGLRRSYAVRSGLTALGWAMALTALLCWLAVIDVDTVDVLPLSLGALAGGALLGISAGLCGFTPMTAFAGLGGGHALESLCVLAGCFLGTLLLPSLDALFAPLRTASPHVSATLFEVTLDEPYLLSGGFLGQACAGILLAAIAICIPSPRPVIIEVEPTSESASADSAPAQEALDAAHDASSEEEAADASDDAPDPESTGEDAVVIALEGEEPLIIDTEMDEADAPDSDADDSDTPAE